MGCLVSWVVDSVEGEACAALRWCFETRWHSNAYYKTVARATRGPTFAFASPLHVCLVSISLFLTYNDHCNRQYHREQTLQAN
jgi:hypothetical protein